MKVNIYETIEISDEQRVNLANVLDREVNKPKRQATRDEIKSFVWDHGKDWDNILSDQVHDLLASIEEPEESEEDLVGDEDEEDLLG